MWDAGCPDPHCPEPGVWSWSLHPNRATLVQLWDAFMFLLLGLGWGAPVELGVRSGGAPAPHDELCPPSQSPLAWRWGAARRSPTRFRCPPSPTTASSTRPHPWPSPSASARGRKVRGGPWWGWGTAAPLQALCKPFAPGCRVQPALVHAAGRAPELLRERAQRSAQRRAAGRGDGVPGAQRAPHARVGAGAVGTHTQHPQSLRNPRADLLCHSALCNPFAIAL